MSGVLFMDSLPHTARFARSRRFSTCTRLFKKYFLLPWPRRPWSCLSSRLAILTETLNSSLVQALFLSQRHFCFPLRISPPPLPNRPPPPQKNKNMSGQVSSPPDCVPGPPGDAGMRFPATQKCTLAFQTVAPHRKLAGARRARNGKLGRGE